jgi:peptidoglycan/LPS O-acetylase OafA/YrhL
VALAAAILLSFEQPPLLLASYAVGMTALNLAIALIIDRCVRHPDDRFGRLLNWKPMAFIGVLSYSLYLWQEPFLNRLGDQPINWFPVNLILTFAAALASYYLVEKPFLEIRRRIERRLKARRTSELTALAPDARRAAGATN